MLSDSHELVPRASHGLARKTWFRLHPIARTAAGLAAAAAAFLVAADASAARSFEAAGPSTFEIKTLDASTQVVVPTGAGPYPLVVASHGFSASGENQMGWAKHFASWGMVVAVPSFASPFAPDHAANALVVQGLVATLQGSAAAAHRVAPGAFGLEGHSAGGLSTALAAAKVAPAATVLFDPVDDGEGQGKVAYATMCSPVLGIFAAPSSCNSSGNWKAFASTSKGSRLLFDVVGSTHCDGENAPRGLCGTFCGGGAAAPRQGAYAHYATAFLLANLKGDAAAIAALAAGTVEADGALSGVSRAAGTCATPGPDGGAPDGGSVTPVDAGGGSGSGASTSGGPTSTSTDGTDPSPSSAPSGSSDGCALIPDRARGTRAVAPRLLLGLGAAIALLGAARRRGRRRS